MNSMQKRFLLFLIGCMGIRFLFVIISKKIDIKFLPYLGYLALLPVIGFMYVFLAGSRKTGPETFGEEIWWNNLRPVHALLYAIFAYKAIRQERDAWVYLLIDVVIGLFSFLMYHYYRGDFSKLY